MAPQDVQQVYWPLYLRDEQLKQVTEMKELLTSKSKLMAGENSDYDLMRFLKARGWDVQKASEQYIAMIEWREGQNVDQLRSQGYSYPELPQVKQFYPHFYHKIDRFGRPLYIERLGMLQTSQLLKVTTMDRFITYHIWCWERLKRDKFTICSELAGKPIFTSCIILDLKGVGLKHFTPTVQRFIRKITKIDSSYYPEHLGQMFIINTPAVFKTMWRVVEPWLDPATRQKIRVLGKNYLEDLQEIISIDDIPDFLGGKSAHPDPCVDIGPWIAYNLDQNHSNSNTENHMIEDNDRDKGIVEVIQQQEQSCDIK
eukprot:TRINITY_DN4355_c0_g1_i1.p1 TRINITY_DN4355_c0_g1~~TRINITY_DN4355_c0_g1_i1.p1  ORF type:complete len:313 (-),score=26.03 TRINITY_DN4355_c0_g1_i1:196-1134(-)